MKSLSELIFLAKQKNQRRLVVVAAHDLPVLEAVRDAYEEKLITPILIGDLQVINEICNKIKFKINAEWVIHEPDSLKAATIAVRLIKENKADVIMKGIISTAPLLKAVLNNVNGIKDQETLSHFALFESKYYHKLFGVTDAAMNIAPTLEEKIDIIKNAVHVFHKLGIQNPKVAVIAPLEVVNNKIDSSVHASKLAQMYKNNEITGCIVDGPLALDNAISKEAANHKGICSEVAGDADILMVPDLNTGNVLYKSLIFFGGALSAAIVVGAKVPIVLTSRSDSEQTKHLSIALATLLA